jgi:hypothetical protein
MTSKRRSNIQKFQNNNDDAKKSKLFWHKHTQKTSVRLHVRMCQKQFVRGQKI